VLLPAPFGPISVTHSEEAICALTWSTTRAPPSGTDTASSETAVS
jgi:hypothetical protein